MKTATEADGGTVLDAREVSQRIIEKLMTGHGHKTWGGQARFVLSGRIFQIKDARFGRNCCDVFKLYGRCGEGDCECQWKANVNHMDARSLPQGVLLVDKLDKCPPILLMM